MADLFGLRPYQLDAVSQIERYWSEGKHAILCQLPTGGGKSRIIRQIVDDYSQSKKVIYLIAHRQTLVEQLSNEIKEADIKHGIIQAGMPYIRYRVQVCSMQTLVRRLDKLAEPEILIADECFPRDTMIDGKLIQDIVAGDMVISYDEKTDRFVRNKVLSVMKREYRGDLVRIKDRNRTVHCTTNHPFYTADGWKKAEELCCGEYVRCLWKSVRVENEEKDMLGNLQKDEIVTDHEQDKLQVCIGKAEAQQYDSLSGSKGEAEEYPQGDGLEASYAGREREAYSKACHGYVRATFKRLRYGNRAGNSDKTTTRKRISALLQGRFGNTRISSCNRDRRSLTPSIGTPISRCEEGRIFRYTRLESVEILKQGSREWLDAMREDCHVYNIEVEQTHTYCVQGLVVHNCHHLKSNSYMNILNRWPKAKLLGMTATPQRIDGKGFDDIFDELILGPKMRDLIDAGYLSDYEYYAPASVDMDGVHQVGGDYNAKESLDRVDRKVITGSAVEHYRKYADHQPAIASCVSIAHSEHVAQEFRDAGYKAIAVNSRMDQLEVKRAIAGLKDGSTEILTQCEMLGEGVDIPAATCLIGLRPTASLVIYLQHCGRVLRKAKGKDKAIILDHVGNWSRFGLPDDERVWTLQGKPKGAKEPSKYKRCPECLRPVLVSAKKCEFCGYVWEYEAHERMPAEVEGQLVSIKEVKPDEVQDLMRTISRRAHNLKEAISIAKTLGYKHTSAYHIWVNELHLNVDSIRYI